MLLNTSTGDYITVKVVPYILFWKTKDKLPWRPGIIIMLLRIIFKKIKTYARALIKFDTIGKLFEYLFVVFLSFSGKTSETDAPARFKHLGR